MRYLVVGGGGFIGRQLVKKLANTRQHVRIFDRVPPPAELDTEVEYILGDLCDSDAVREAVAGCEVIFHLACTTHPKTSNDDPAYDIQSNVLGTLRLLDVCVATGVHRVVFNSSGGTVYGIPLKMPISEDHPTDPICSYGITRLTIEKYLHLYHVLHGLDYVILRPANAYGEGQDPNRGQGVVAAFLGCISQGRLIEVWGDGSVVRDYVHVEDIARALRMVAEATPKDRILNVGSGTGIALNELIHLMKGITGRKFSVNYKSGRPFDIPEVVLDNHRIRDQVGWSPQVTIHDGLERTWRWLKDWKG